MVRGAGVQELTAASNWSYYLTVGFVASGRFRSERLENLLMKYLLDEGASSDEEVNWNVVLSVRELTRAKELHNAISEIGEEHGSENHRSLETLVHLYGYMMELFGEEGIFRRYYLKSTVLTGPESSKQVKSYPAVEYKLVRKSEASMAANEELETGTGYECQLCKFQRYESPSPCHASGP